MNDQVKPSAEDFDKATKNVMRLESDYVTFANLRQIFYGATELAAARAADRAEPPFCDKCGRFYTDLNPNCSDRHTVAIEHVKSAPPAREPSVAVSKLRELLRKWAREGVEAAQTVGYTGPIANSPQHNELKALCDRAAEEKGT